MTREQLLERRAVLLLAYQDAESAEQLVEIERELQRIGEELAATRPVKGPAARMRRGWWDGRAAAVGRDD